MKRVLQDGEASEPGLRERTATCCHTPQRLVKARVAADAGHMSPGICNRKASTAKTHAADGEGPFMPQRWSHSTTRYAHDKPKIGGTNSIMHIALRSSLLGLSLDLDNHPQIVVVQWVRLSLRPTTLVLPGISALTREADGVSSLIRKGLEDNRGELEPRQS
ncbi:unnamed protein product [Boreogadus saida]